uniref:Uncharacterized protein n=1 Tax=Ochrobactrum phage ORM_20 TaxID=2985243 RepID=A0A9N6ZFZ1_9VIRU|nr:hypothetical protein ORM20_00052 [Ochrobactrum phage ORM_20]
MKDDFKSDVLDPYDVIADKWYEFSSMPLEYKAHINGRPRWKFSVFAYFPEKNEYGQRHDCFYDEQGRLVLGAGFTVDQYQYPPEVLLWRLPMDPNIPPLCDKEWENTIRRAAGCLIRARHIDIHTSCPSCKTTIRFQSKDDIPDEDDTYKCTCGVTLQF